MGKNKGNGDVTPRKSAPTKKKDMSSQDDAMSLFGGSASEMFDSFIGGNDGEDSEEKQLLDSLKSQLGHENLKDIDSIPDVFSSPKTPTTPKASIMSADESLIPVEAMSGLEVTRPALSPDEAEDLLRRLDRMTDEQVEKVFEKMRASLASSTKKEIEAAMEEKRKDGARKPMPKATPTDSEIRKKYDNELSAIENELENLYNDPLKVWQDIMLNPNRYISEEEAKQIEDEKLQ
jgi:hypothetical protein